jgi:hypothetical protein
MAAKERVKTSVTGNNVRCQLPSTILLTRVIIMTQVRQTTSGRTAEMIIHDRIHLKR